MKKRIVTSALPYVNNFPHLGNVIGCVLSGDVYTRFSKKKGVQTIHVCGTDEFGTATEMSALEKNCHPSEICSENRKVHKQIYDWFDIHFDFFGKTNSEKHIALTQEIFLKIKENGFLEEKEIQQFFCETCQIFLADRYVIGKCFKCGAEGAKGDQCDACGVLLKDEELLDPLCFICKKTPAFKTTKHIFLKLNCLENKIKSFVNKSCENWSKNAKSIALDWCNKELQSRCITRDLKFKWGVPVPLKDYNDKVLYVWFDAPIGYISFVKEIDESYLEDSELIEFMGKDNVPFHSIFFPGMMIAAGINFLPSMISATDYLLFENKKFSKSNKHGIFGYDLIDDKLGENSIWRYYLLKFRPETKPSNFSLNEFFLSYEADLMNNIGNFTNRTLKFIKSKLNGLITYETEIKSDVITQLNELYYSYMKNMEEINLREGLQIALQVSHLGNNFLQSHIQCDDKIRKTAFSYAVTIIYCLSHLIEPFMPKVSQKIKQLINLSEEKFPEKISLLPNNHKISENIEILFKPLSKEIVDGLMKFS